MKIRSVSTLAISRLEFPDDAGGNVTFLQFNFLSFKSLLLSSLVHSFLVFTYRPFKKKTYPRGSVSAYLLDCRGNVKSLL